MVFALSAETLTAFCHNESIFMNFNLTIQHRNSTSLAHAADNPAYYRTVAGTLKVSLAHNAILGAHFVEDEEACASELSHIDTIVLQGTPFQLKVWQEVAKIPQGSTVTYHDIARAIGHEKAWRAVANAVGSNEISYFIPCHRVVRKNGQLGGYRWGIARKAALLKHEGIVLSNAV
jgi:O-6-methylguanine DNA methyltransferase